MNEAEEQPNCPYCHYHHGIRMLIRGEHQCVSIMPRTHYKLGTTNFVSNETDMVSIHYCPMCGRKLGDNS